jgi:DNA-binding NarL/FixJ family response regulator
MTIRVVVVDDHTLTRYGLAGLIEECPDIELVGEATVSGSPATAASTWAS